MLYCCFTAASTTAAEAATAVSADNAGAVIFFSIKFLALSLSFSVIIEKNYLLILLL